MAEAVQTPMKNTVDENEISHFDKLAKEFWDEKGAIKGLLAMNKLRVPFIRDGLLGMKQANEATDKEPLEGYQILDVGCGAGILSEPLARIGANVTGIDVSKELINVACTHVKQDPAITDKITYIYETVEDHAQQKPSFYDAVVASEVIEHVTEKEAFLESCIACLKKGIAMCQEDQQLVTVLAAMPQLPGIISKPGGSVFITTPNRSVIMWIFGIFLFEYVFRILPIGTHHLDKCIRPHELQALLEKNDCSTKLIRGIIYNLLNNEWYWSPMKSAVYALHAVKRR